MRKVVSTLLLLLFLLIGLAFCRSVGAPPDAAQLQAVPAQTPFATTPPMTVTEPTTQPVARAVQPVAQVEQPAENSEWYIDGWAEDAIVVNVYGREIRFDLAEFRNTQTNVAIVVQCIDPGARRPHLDFAVPVEQRDRFVYRGNLFWHTADPAVQRFIFLRYGELQ